MTAQHRPIAGYVVLTLVFRQEGRRWTGECLELGTATYGRTLRQARDELVELVELHLATLEQTGERDRVLAERGIALYQVAAPPTVVEQRVPVSGESYVQPHAFPLKPAA